MWGFVLDLAGSRNGHVAVKAVMNIRGPENAGNNLAS